MLAITSPVAWVSAKFVAFAFPPPGSSRSTALNRGSSAAARRQISWVASVESAS
jgi:hypothetical protein